MANPELQAETGPVSERARITSLDLIRGIAVLGILLMNAVHFKFGEVPYLNISAGGSETWLDWTVGIFGEIFVDQKFMGLFSLLFGAGVILFIDRAAARGGRAALLNMWRNLLLLLIGVLHFQLWVGDILMIYACSSFVLLALRKLSAKALIAIGAVIFLSAGASDLFAQSMANAGAALGGLWEHSDEYNETLTILSWSGYIIRGLGMIIIGAGLYRTGFMNGGMASSLYRRTAIIGLGVGLSLATAGVVVTALGDYSRDVAFIGQVPNTLGTIPASLGYMALIILWNNGADNWLKRRLRAAGRMALTNYLTQTVMGVLVLTVWLGDADWVNRSAILVFVFAVWALQLWWSQAWLNRFLYGPAEWAWRVATYRKGQPLRRARESD